MRSTAFVILALVATSAFATRSFLGSHEKLHNALNVIDGTQFGQDLLDTIALQMSNQSPISDIASLISEMQNDLRSQQQSADEAEVAKQTECSEELAGYTGRQEAARSEITAATNALRRLRSERTALKTSIETRESQLVTLDNEEAAAIKNRAYEKETYFAAAEQTQQVLEALEVILPKLNAITPHTAEEVFVELAKLGASNPIAALVEVASALNADALARCIGLLEDLQTSFQEFLVDGQQQEIDAQYAYDNFLIFVKNQRAQTKKLLAQDVEQLAECESNIEQQLNRLHNNQGELESATAGFNAKSTECDAYFATYERESDQRSAELGILSDVANIVSTKLASLNSFLEER